jgi:hypothetical protein
VGPRRFDSIAVRTDEWRNGERMDAEAAANRSARSRDVAMYRTPRR